jgi:hypothetical protein
VAKVANRFLYKKYPDDVMEDNENLTTPTLRISETPPPLSKWRGDVDSSIIILLIG